jgi:hypothetical protein
MNNGGGQEGSVVLEFRINSIEERFGSLVSCEKSSCCVVNEEGSGWLDMDSFQGRGQNHVAGSLLTGGHRGYHDTANALIKPLEQRPVDGFR